MNRITLLARLLEAKAITFEEALFLMEKEKEYIYYPQYMITNPPYTITNYPTYSTGTITLSNN